MRWRLDAGQIEVVDADLAAVLRQKAPWERAEMIFAANRFVRQRMEAQLRTEHPDYSTQQIASEIARRMCDGAG